MAPREDFHAFDGEYWKRSEWAEMPDSARRVRLAVGDAPIPDLRHLVPPLALRAPESPVESRLAPSERDRLRRRFARAVELPLAAHRPFPARDIWRAALSLGFVWGNLDLFHFRDADSGDSLFTLHGLGGSGAFLPERAAEGAAVAGVVLALEVPLSPDPVAVFDRMALALAALRERLGGRPVARDGSELDGQGLDALRAEVEDAVAVLTIAGVRPGSPAARQAF